MRGALYTAPNHIAIREGRKTQTRRPIAVDPAFKRYHLYEEDGLAGFVSKGGDIVEVRAKLGGVGTRNYVREAWRTDRRFDNLSPREAMAASACFCEGDFPVMYEMDRVGRGHWRKWPPDEENDPLGRLRSPLFLPADLARTRYTIVGLKVERLWDISEYDAKAEGVDPVWEVLDFLGPKVLLEQRPSYRIGFFKVWNELYSDHPIKGYAANPWVFAYTIGEVEAL